MLPPARRQPYFIFLLITVLGACLASAILVAATVPGPCLSHDSVIYMGAARSLLAGQGLMIPFGYSRPLPLRQWPPLYPLMLALAGLLNPDLESAARWFSIALFALNTVLIACLARRFTRSATFGLAAGFLFAVSLPMLRLHSPADFRPSCSSPPPPASPPSRDTPAFPWSPPAF